MMTATGKYPKVNPTVYWGKGKRQREKETCALDVMMMKQEG